MNGRAIRRLGVVALVAALSACGSTVQVHSAVRGATADGLSTGTSGSAPSSSVNGGAAGPGGSGGLGGAGGLGTAGSGGSQGSAGSPGGGSSGAGAGIGAGPTTSNQGSAGRFGPGVDSGSIRIGFQYVDVGTGTAGVLGKNVSIGDPKAQANAVKDWINTHGGLGGRKMTLDIYGAGYSDYVSNSQAVFNQICTHYTQDTKVLAVAVYVPDRTLIDCLARRDVISVSDGYSLDRRSLDDYRKYYWVPGSMSQDRGAEVGVVGHYGSGFLTKAAKIGILRYDEITYARAEVSLRKALAAKGLNVVTTHTISYASTAQAEQDASAAVLDFRARGITHVMVLDNSGGITYAFMQSAESQQYRPFYALTTNNSPQALAQLAPAAQLAKAQAVSWWSGDVGTRTDQATPPATPASMASCLAIMRKAGVDMTGAAAGSSLITCDQLLLLKAVLDRAAAPNSDDMTSALDGLGGSYSSPLSYATRFEPGRHDAAYLTRRIKFDSTCSCWLYAGPGPTA